MKNVRYLRHTKNITHWEQQCAYIEISANDCTKIHQVVNLGRLQEVSSNPPPLQPSTKLIKYWITLELVHKSVLILHRNIPSSRNPIVFMGKNLGARRPKFFTHVFEKTVVFYMHFLKEKIPQPKPIHCFAKYWIKGGFRWRINTDVWIYLKFIIFSCFINFHHMT